MPRPYISSSIDALEREVDTHKDNVAELKKIKAELKHRKPRLRNKNLMAVIDGWIKGEPGFTQEELFTEKQKTRVKSEQKKPKASPIQKGSSVSAAEKPDKPLMENKAPSAKTGIPIAKPEGADHQAQRKPNPVVQATVVQTPAKKPAREDVILEQKREDKQVEYPDGFLHQNFDDMRTKLLDIAGGRSRLISLDQNGKSFVRLVDELPDQLVDTLLKNKAMTLVPVPEPTREELEEHGYIAWDEEEARWNTLKPDPAAKQWAGVLGLKNDYELPDNSDHADDERHEDLDLQTLVFEPALNVKLQKLSREAKTAIDETGNNILFLCLGFLEWSDVAKGGNKRYAPLYMVPVEITKDVNNGVSVFRLAFTGEDILPNLTLREKLKRDFGIILPDVVDADDEDRLLSPEQYFDAVNALLARKSNDPNIKEWRVRRFGTLATLSLGKLLMYLDLDPARWPDNGKALLEHEVVSHFFHDGAKRVDGQSSSGAGHADYVLDDVEDIHENFPMIEDADSSQMSALIDILKGNSMVVEGPPGTGKSQTITNLLAAAMAQSKTVLFVAEKQAALDVVKRRMDKAGLGDFCLDLHSDKAQKRLVLDSFNERMLNQRGHAHSVDEYDRQVQRYERARQQLQDYVQMINDEWKATGMTLHEILAAATRYGEAVSPIVYSDVAPEGISGVSFSKVLLDEALEKLESYYEYLAIVSKQLPDAGNWESHPWYGVGNKALGSVPENEIAASMGAWIERIETVNASASAFYTRHGLDAAHVNRLDALETAIEKWQVIPLLSGGEVVSAFRQIGAEDVAPLHAAAQQIKTVASGFSAAGNVFPRDVITDAGALETIKESLAGLALMGVARSLSFDEINRAINDAEKAKRLLASTLERRNEFLPNVKPALREALAGNVAGLKEFSRFCEHAAALETAHVNYRDPLFDNDGLVDLIAKAKAQSDALVERRGAFEQDFAIDKLPSIEDIKHISAIFGETSFISIFKSSWRAAKKSASAFIVHEKVDCNAMAGKLHELAIWLEDVDQFAKEATYSEKLEGFFKGVETDWEKVSSLAAWFKRVRADYGIGFGRRVIFASELFSLDQNVFRGVRNLHADGLSMQIDAFVSLLERLGGVFTQQTLFSDADVDFAADLNPLQSFLFDISAYMKGIQQSLLDASLPQDAVIAALTSLDAAKQAAQAVSALALSETYFNASLNLTLSSNGQLPDDYQPFLQTVAFAEAVHAVQFSDLVLALNTCDTAEDVSVLVQGAAALTDDHKAMADAEASFFALVESSRSAWFKDSGLAFDKVIARNHGAKTNVRWLDGWLKYLHARDRMDTVGFNKLKELLLKDQGTLEHAKDVMRFAAFQALAREIYQNTPALSERSGHEQTVLQGQFAKYDETLKELQRKRVAAIAAATEIPEGTSGARVANYSGGHLLRHEVGKKRGHISIRHLVERAGKAMQAYKPCFMMSPMAVAKYLPPGSIEFDLVVMDEASQVKPEYALSCFARGKNVVVVGDPKQLPPTSFFERSVSNDDEDFEDVGVIGEAESILDAVGGHFKQRQLRWHYRSKHESLIEFSNHKFYDSNLVLFPSPWAESDEFGIKFNYVETGRFLNNVNVAESQAVIQAIKVQLMDRPDESVGIVAMNSKQRDHIESDLESALRDDNLFRAAYQKNMGSADPLFIKNLENVQGDERDVIFISFTYGPNEKGSKHVPQRFGPINSDDGWRRLNVLFTRAKKRIQVYSSMTADQVNVSDTSKRGVKSLKAYLAYAQTGMLVGQAGVQQKEPDSDFEIAVMDALAKHGFECVPQVGVAGFFIDIAVRDPGMPGRYLMGIECDGATYHSSKSTRDRDRVRQGVLEGLGWEIRRIWSTDWFKHPEAELKPIIDELKRKATPISELPVDAVVETSACDNNSNEEATYESYSSQTLEQRLKNFADNVISKEFPDTASEKRLLRPEMIERLVSDMPTSNEDFTVFIPAYLRKQTDTKESFAYLVDVLEIVAEYEDESFRHKEKLDGDN
ncbi:RecBCD enzyme subunit RecD [BD1-7 clade bacterium]|nr:RecBCD enzyme subunit RecD [BD1-7 clade bacterium]